MVPDPFAGVFFVLIAGSYVQVGMVYCLAGWAVDIPAQIVTMGCFAIIYELFEFWQERMECRPLCLVDFKGCLDMAFGYSQTGITAFFGVLVGKIP